MLTEVIACVLMFIGPTKKYEMGRLYHTVVVAEYQLFEIVRKYLF